MEFIRVEECCEILDSQRKPVTESERVPGMYPYYGANGIQGTINQYIFDDKLVLVAEDGGHFGSKTKPIAYLVNGKCWVNNHAHVLRAKKGFLAEYICYSLMFYKIEGYINGATRQKLTQAALRKLIIPKKSVEYQKAIVDRLDLVKCIIEKKQNIINELDLLIKSRFDELIIGEKCDRLMFNDLFFCTTGKLDSNAAVKGGRYPFFTCAKEIFYINDYAFNQEALLLAGNNAAGKYDVKYYNGKFNAYQRTYILSLRKKGIYSIFKKKLEDKLEYLQSQSKGSTTRYLTMGILKNLTFCVPDMEIQLKLDKEIQQINKLKSDVQKSIDETQYLMDSLMQEYFG